MTAILRKLWDAWNTAHARAASSMAEDLHRWFFTDAPMRRKR